MAKPGMARDSQPGVDWSKELKATVDDEKNNARPVGRDADFNVDQAERRKANTNAEHDDRLPEDEVLRREKAKNKSFAKNRERDKDKKTVKVAEALKIATNKESNVTPEEKKEAEAVKVEVEKGVEDAAKEITENPDKQVDILVKNNTLSPEQGIQVRAALKSEPVKKGFLASLKQTIKENPAGFLGGIVAGTGVRMAVKLGALASFGASLPVLLGAGMAAGAGIEGFKAAWRESKTYDYKEIMDRFRNSGYLDRAAMLSQLESINSKQKFNVSPQESLQIKQVLADARAELQAELDKKDGKFANQGEREKIEYILKLSQGESNGLESSSRSKEARDSIKNINKSLDKNYSSRKFSALKGKWGVVGKAALKGAFFGMLGSGLAAGAGALASEFMGHGAAVTTQIVETKGGTMASEFAAHLDHRGITGGARDILHDFINEQRGIDPNFAHGVTLEQMIYAEDLAKNAALHSGVSVNAHDLSFTHDQLMGFLEKANIIGHSGPLTTGGMEHIHHMIGHAPHYVSEATSSSIMNFTPDQLNAAVAEVISQPGPLIMTATDFATMNTALLATSLLESISLQEREQAKSHLEYIKANAKVVPDKESGKPSPSLETPLPKKNEKFPDVTPPSPDTTPAAELYSIPKPEGNPFESMEKKGNEKRPTNKELNEFAIIYANNKRGYPETYDHAIQFFQLYSEGKHTTHRDQNLAAWTDNDFKKLLKRIEHFVNKAEKFNNPDDAVEPEEPAETPRVIENTKDGEITPRSVNDKLSEARLEAKIFPWPRDGATPEQEAQIDHITDLFINSAKKLKGHGINNRVIINFSREGDRSFDFRNGQYYINIPLNNEYEQDSFDSLINIMVDQNKADALLRKLTKEYKFKNGPEMRAKLEKLSPSQRYEMLQLLLAEYQKGKVNPKPKGVKIDLDKLTPHKFNGLNLKEIRAQNPNILDSETYKNIPELQRRRAEILFYKIVNLDMSKGLPPNTKIVFSDRSAKGPGWFSIDMSHNDEETMRKQLHEGRRYAISGKDDVIEGPIPLPASSKENEIYRADPQKIDRIIEEALAEAQGKELPDTAPQSDTIDLPSDSEQEEKSEEVNQLWVDWQKSKISKIPRTQAQKFDQYFKSTDKNKILAVALKLLRDNNPIYGTANAQLEKYARLHTIETIEELINSGEENSAEKAKALKDSLKEFEDALKQLKKDNKKTQRLPKLKK